MSKTISDALRELPIPKLDSDEKYVRGYAVVYNSLSLPMSFKELGDFREVVRSGAAKEFIATAGDIPCLFGHDSSKLLGRTSSKTLELWEDTTGVGYCVTLPDTGDGRDVRELVKRGDIRGASVMQLVPKGGDRWQRTSEGRLREITKLGIGEISLTPFPAYQDTSAALRSWLEWEKATAGVPLSVRRKQIKLASM